MKKNIVIVLLIVLTIVISIFILDKNNTKGRIIVKIENIEYNIDKNYKLTDKKVDNGYIIYSNGKVIKYDNIENKEDKIKTIEKYKINNIITSIEKIDESKVSTIMPELPISSGSIITVYNNENKTIIIKDFYNTNYSESTDDIIQILKQENLL